MDDPRRWHRNQLEHRLTHPEMLGLRGAHKEQALALRDEWIAELHAIDLHLADELARRRELVDKIMLANRSVVGTGSGVDVFGKTRQYWWRPSALPFVDPVFVAAPDAHEEEGARWAAAGDPPALTGRALRDAVNAILRATGAAMTATELARVIGAHGYAVATPTRSIPNALRPDLACGRVDRPAHGVYRAVPPEPAPGAA